MQERFGQSESVSETPETPVISIDSVESPDEQLENIAGNIDRQNGLLETNIARIVSMNEAMHPQEMSFVMGELEHTESAKNATEKTSSALLYVIEKANAILSHGHNKEHELAHKYNPRVVKVVSATGKAIGGMFGMFAGHGLLSATGAVVGAKVGQSAFLGVYEGVKKLQERFFTTKDIQEEGHEKTLTSEEKVQRDLEEAERIEKRSEQNRERIQNLTAEQKERLQEKLMHSETFAHATDAVISTNETSALFFKDFEKKYPAHASLKELIIHHAIGTALSASGIGHGIVLALELVAAAGGAEKITGAVHNLVEDVHKAEPRQFLAEKARGVKKAIFNRAQEIIAFMNRSKQETVEPLANAA